MPGKWHSRFLFCLKLQKTFKQQKQDGDLVIWILNLVSTQGEYVWILKELLLVSACMVIYCPIFAYLHTVHTACLYLLEQERDIHDYSGPKVLEKWMSSTCLSLIAQRWVTLEQETSSHSVAKTEAVVVLRSSQLWLFDWTAGHRRKRPPMLSKPSLDKWR